MSLILRVFLIHHGTHHRRRTGLLQGCFQACFQAVFLGGQNNRYLNRYLNRLGMSLMSLMFLIPWVPQCRLLRQKRWLHPDSIG
jgi:hypothetical protein